MISKAAVKRIRSLGARKHREREGLFVAEGRKTIEEISRTVAPVETYFGEDAARASLLRTPQGELALFPADIFSRINPVSELFLMLDGVQDPGNLGTIIRVADWFGIDRIVCSPDTADALSPKVVQASMGSVARVRVEYAGLAGMLDSLPGDFPVYGTALDGAVIYGEKLSSRGVIVMGNEGNGIRGEVMRRVGRRLFVPGYPPGQRRAESLNVAAAAAVVCSEFRRRQFKV